MFKLTRQDETEIFVNEHGELAIVQRDRLGEESRVFISRVNLADVINELTRLKDDESHWPESDE